MWFDNPVHLAILALIVLIVLGPKRLPETARSLGRGVREFKDSITGDSREHEERKAVTAATTPPVAEKPLEPASTVSAEPAAVSVDRAAE